MECARRVECDTCGTPRSAPSGQSVTDVPHMCLTPRSSPAPSQRARAPSGAYALLDGWWWAVEDERNVWEAAMRVGSKSHTVTVKYFYDTFQTWQVG
eukprot:720284-Prorocentrum_minimum.AAC.1